MYRQSIGELEHGDQLDLRQLGLVRDGRDVILDLSWSRLGREPPSLCRLPAARLVTPTAGEGGACFPALGLPLDLDAPGLGFFALGDPHGQDPIVERGLGLVCLDSGRQRRVVFEPAGAAHPAARPPLALFL